MARRRIIDPAIWTDEKFGELSLLSKLMFIGLVSIADDEGRGSASPNYLKIKIMPYDSEITHEIVKISCMEIAIKMNVVFYQDNAKTYYQILKFHDWQTISRPTPSKIPPFDNAKMTQMFHEKAWNIHGVFSEYSMSIHGVFSEIGRKLEENWKNSGNKSEENRKEIGKKSEILNIDDLSLISSPLSLKDLSIKEDDLKKKNTQKKKVENDENEDLLLDDDTYTQRFNVFWKAYKNKKGSKAKCHQWFKTRKVSNKLLDEMLKAIEVDDIARSQAIANNRFYPEKPFAQTWLNQRRWETILENATQINSNERNDGDRENIPPKSQTSPSVSKNGENDDLDMSVYLKELEEHRKGGK